jgi:hypothetical protein
MTEVFKKLNYKAHKRVLVYAAPASFEPELAAMSEAEIHRKPKPGSRYDFVLSFTPMKTDLVKAAKLLTPFTEYDAVVWFAYPKQSSKAFTSDLSRELCWEALIPFGLQPVWQIAIDDDWSALRFKSAT